MTTPSPGILGSLTNKVTYDVTNLVTDPKANEFANKQQEEKKKLEENEKNKKLDEERKKAEEAKQKEEQKNIFVRFLTKVVRSFNTAIGYIIVPFTALMLSMLVVNDMIIYSAPVRLLFFIFTFLLLFFIPFYSFIVIFIFVIRALIALYNNKLTDSNVIRKYLPTVFNILPILSYNPKTESRVPLLTFAKTDKSVDKLINILSDYIQSLKESFKDFDKFKDKYDDNLKQIIENFIKSYKLEGKIKREKIDELLHF